MGMRDLGTPLIRLMGREHPYLTGDQKTQCVDGVPDRANVGDDGDALPLREVFDADAEDFPRCAGEAATDLVIEPDLVVPFQRGLHGFIILSQSSLVTRPVATLPTTLFGRHLSSVS